MSDGLMMAIDENVRLPNSFSGGGGAAQLLRRKTRGKNFTALSERVERDSRERRSPRVIIESKLLTGVFAVFILSLPTR